MNNNASEDIHNYCKNHTESDSDILLKLEKYTWENEEIPQMVSGQLVGKFLKWLVKYD